MYTTQLASTLIKAGVIAPGRPDRVAKQLAALRSWGLSLAGGYTSAAARDPDRIALIDERRQVTFAELIDRATRISQGLAQRGVQGRTRVAVLCRNHAGLIEALVASAMLGADTVLMNTGLSGSQLQAVLREQKVELLIADDEFVRLIGGPPPGVPLVVAWDEDGGHTTLEDLVGGNPGGRAAPPEIVGRTIVLTSGTTGAPKGARRPPPHGLGALASILSKIPLKVRDTIAIPAPLFHTWGFAGLQVGMGLRATLVLRRRFDPETALADLADHHANGVFVVPIMMQRMLELSPDVRAKYDLSALRAVASSGSALIGDFALHFMDAFGDVLYNLYGSTEVSWATIATPADLRRAPRTAGGKPLGTRIAILDAEGRELPVGTPGRIFVANGMLFEGYTNGAGKEVKDGFMSTGDVGHLDDTGLLFVDGRDDDMIVSGGENVFPREVENILTEAAEVREVAVLGVPDPEWGQRLVAYVVLHEGSALDAEGVRELVKARAARYCVPRDVHFLPELPRNATGKVVPRLLRGV
ncbi:AMP-binding protein [Cryptosporangium phraense]|uniref:AMP-binding protein n=1 Tax=Cryptosporangium phraense TaxID=2593070 RepID=A0A545AU94_9ACTN|nr:AMP-binding protein [Cryptosporangium phraense]TQS44909.1 AMP-binding protein [Cryptosporangium phraense]